MQNPTFQPNLTRPSSAGSDPVSQWLLRIAQFALIVSCGLFPIVFIPIAFAPFMYSKVLVLLFGLTIALVFFVLAVLRNGTLTIRLPVPLVALWAVAIITLVSALFSGDMADALLGNAFGAHTAAFVILLAVVASLMGLLHGSKRAVMRLYLLFLLSAVLLGLFHVLRVVFGADALTFGLFTSAVASPFGSWNDVALYFGLTILLALVAVEQLPLTKMGRFILCGIAAVALVMLAIINFVAVWFVLGLVSLVMLMFSLVRSRFAQPQLAVSDDTGSVISIVLSLVIFVMSLVFLIGGSSVGSMMSNLTGISYVEVRPSMMATFDIMRQVYTEAPLSGVGPNRFADAWRAHKDPSINQTLFWNTDFEAGGGYVLTNFVTAGVFGALAWISFLGLLLVAGWRFLTSREQGDRFWRFVGTSSLVAALYLWGMSVMFVPTAAILLLAAMCTGVFMVAYTMFVPHRTVQISALENRNLLFVMVGVVMLIIIGSVGVVYTVSQHYGALYSFNRAIATAAPGDSIADIERAIATAYQRSPNDVFARELAGYQLAELNALITVTEPTGEQQQAFQESAVVGINAAREAVAADPTEPANWQLLGQIYSLLVVGGVEGADAEARTAFARAAELNPHSPFPPLLVAQLESRLGDIPAARAAAEEALVKKSDYTEALLFLSQLDIAEGNVADAIARTRSIISIEPSNPARYYQLGILESANGNTTGAIEAYRAATQLDPGFANARYFLAIELAGIGETEAAAAEMRVVAELNPDNVQVAELVAQLERGESLGVDAAPSQPVDEADPISVSDDGQQVTTTEAPDTDLVVPVNTVPETTEAPEAPDTPTETTPATDQ
jgi:tetratricopeptide (TPR) repeat protein